MDLLDTAVTVLLFVGLLGWIWTAVVVGAMSVMLGDSGTPGLSWLGMLLAAVGVPVTVIATFVIAAAAAWRADGVTFWYPLIALGLGTVAAGVVWVLGYGIVAANLALFGTDRDRCSPLQPRSPDAAAARGATASDPGPVSVSPSATVPDLAPGPAVFEYTVIQRITDGGMSIELGVEKHTGRRYLRTPMPQRGGEYDEYHGIDVATYATFGTDHAAALRFAAECREGLHRNRWLPPAGFPALEPVSPDSTRLTGRIATLLTDRPTTATGSPVTGLPLGTPFVVIVDQIVDSNGELGVRLPGAAGEVVRIAARHLGRA